MTPPLDFRAVLRQEYESGEGAFLFTLHCYGRWDWDVFLRLFHAMRECCLDHEGKETVERWIVSVFYTTHQYVTRQVERGEPWNTGRFYNAWVNLDHLTHWLLAEGSRDFDSFELMDG